MRIAVLIAASALLAGCSSTASDDTGSTRAALTPTRTTTATSTTPTTTPKATTAAKPPSASAPIADVIGWIESGKTVDASTYHSATRAGKTTNLGEDVAFTGPSGTPNCMTAARFDGALACLVDLTDPPPRPADVYGQWKGGWVDFGGTSAEVGSAHGDPGRFNAGTGPDLPFGRTLAFGDYRCRTDPAGVYCVNYAHQSAVKFDATGIETFGCLRATTAPAGIGEKFTC